MKADDDDCVFYPGCLFEDELCAPYEFCVNGRSPCFTSKSAQTSDITHSARLICASVWTVTMAMPHPAGGGPVTWKVRTWVLNSKRG